MMIHLALGSGGAKKLGRPIIDWRKEEIWESAKRRNWMNGFSSWLSVDEIVWLGCGEA